MLLGKATSINNFSIRLTSERWLHIRTAHPELENTTTATILEVIHNPELILQGDFGELLAVKRKSRKDYWLVVVYKEVSNKDGFIITAYVTSDTRWLFKRKSIWNKK